MFRDDIEEDFHVDGQPKENEVFFKCPECGEVYNKVRYDERHGWDISIPDFDVDLIREKKIKYIIFMCWDCFDEREYCEEEYNDDGDFPLDVLCYDQYMNLVHQVESYY